MVAVSTASRRGKYGGRCPPWDDIAAVATAVTAVVPVETRLCNRRHWGGRFPCCDADGCFCSRHASCRCRLDDEPRGHSFREDPVGVTAVITAAVSAGTAVNAISVSAGTAVNTTAVDATAGAGTIAGAFTTAAVAAVATAAMVAVPVATRRGNCRGWGVRWSSCDVDGRF